MLMAATIISILLATACVGETPIKFEPGIISTANAHEGLDWISENGRHLLFTRVTPDFSSARLMQAMNVDGHWSIEQIAISTGPYDAGLAISPDATEAVFTSTRAGEGIDEGDWNIWRAAVSKTSEVWEVGVPSALPAPVNSAKSDCCAVYGKDGEVFFSSDRDGSWKLYRATRDAGNYLVEPLAGQVNTKDGAWPSAYLPDEDVLIFSSIRKSGMGGDDIYYSHRQNDAWSPARLLAEPVNKDGFQDGARVFKGEFYWSSRPKRDTEAPTGELQVSDIFFMPSACVDTHK